MKFVNRFFMILVALCLVCPGVSAVVNPKPFVIPELKEWKGAEGAFVPTETTKNSLSCQSAGTIAHCPYAGR